MPKYSTIERIEIVIDRTVTALNNGFKINELPEDLKVIFDRWCKAYDIHRKYYHKGRDYIEAVYMAWCHNTYGVTDKRTIVEDVFAAPLLFAKIDPVNREFKRMIAIERIERNIARAEANGKYDQVARLEAVLFKYLNPADDPIPEQDFDEIGKNFKIEPVFNPQLLGVKNYSYEYIQRMKDSMLSRKKVMLDNFEEAELINDSDELEDRSTI